MSEKRINQPRQEASSGWGGYLEICIMLPFMIFLGLYVALLAYVARKYLRIPYVIGVFAVFALELFIAGAPSWVWLTVLGILFASHLFCSYEDWLDECNADCIPPAHMVFMLWLMMPPLSEIVDKLPK